MKVAAVLPFCICFFLEINTTFSQVNNFPHTQSFEQAFNTGTEVAFLQHWWGNEVSSGSRIFRSISEGMGGSAALSAVPTSSFTADIRLQLDTRSLPGVALNFWARSAQHGSGARSTQLLLSFSANGGASFTDPILVGGENAFPNADTDYALYTYSVPPELAENSQSVIRWQVKRSENGAGTAARVLLDEVQLVSATPQLQLLTVEALSATELLLMFNMPLQKSPAENLANYRLDPEVAIRSAKLQENDLRQVRLLVDPLVAGTYILTATELLAADGTAPMPASSVTFTYSSRSHYRDVVINEIFADPNPKGSVRPQPVVLPTDAKAEFIELFNASATTYTLKDLALNNNKLPAFSLAPESYVLLVPSGKGEAYSNFSPVVEVPGWKSLSNSGTSLILTHTESGTLLDSLSYALNWYREYGKQEGGWSLEQINPYLQCSHAGNWRASTNTKGATPAAPNAVLDTSPDTLALQLLQAATTDPQQVLLMFNEPLAPASLKFAHVALEPAAAIASLQLQGRQVVIQLAAPLQHEVTYTIHIAGFADCSGNSLEASTLLIQPRPAETGELVINEIMYDPAAGEPEWVELHNPGTNYIDIQGWYLGLQEKQLKATAKLGDDLLLMPPGGYLVLAESPEAILEVYPQTPPKNVLLLPDMPNLRNSGDTLVLLMPDATLSEVVPFNNNVHHPLLANSKGVSLERISPAAPAIAAANWTSSAAPHWATPGLTNAQQFKTEAPISSALRIEPEVVEPTPDGVADVAMIHYQLPQPGLSGSLFILDAGGREVLRLADNEILGLEGFFQWNGTNSFGDRVRNGYYVVVLSVLGTDGFSSKWQKPIVVSSWL